MKTPKQFVHGADLSAIEVRHSDTHGQGVFALRRLRARQVIGHYTGRRYPADESQSGWDSQLTYLFGLSDGSVIDGDDPADYRCAYGADGCRGTMAVSRCRSDFGELSSSPRNRLNGHAIAREDAFPCQ